MFEENQECKMCDSKKVRHDRVKGNVKCFSCGYIVESHYQTFEQEVNNYENDPDQMNKMRGLVQEGKDFKIKIGKEIIDDQPKKRKKGDEDNSKKVLKQLHRWCESLQFEKCDVIQIEEYYQILMNMDQSRQQSSTASITTATTSSSSSSFFPVAGSTSGVGGGASTASTTSSGSSGQIQKDIAYNVLKRRAVISIFMFTRLLKLNDEPEFSLENICDLACVRIEDVKKEIEHIRSARFQDEQLIFDILFEKKTIHTIAEQYANECGLGANDKAGYLAFCQQMKDSEISSGEQIQTKAAAALYAVFKLSNSPEVNCKTLKDLHAISSKSESTIKKFFDGPIMQNIQVMLEAIKYQQYNWRHWNAIRKE